MRTWYSYARNSLTGMRAWRLCLHLGSQLHPCAHVFQQCILLKHIVLAAERWYRFPSQPVLSIARAAGSGARIVLALCATVPNEETDDAAHGADVLIALAAYHVPPWLPCVTVLSLGLHLSSGHCLLQLGFERKFVRF